jgi:transposase
MKVAKALGVTVPLIPTCIEVDSLFSHGVDPGPVIRCRRAGLIREGAMGGAVPLRMEFSASELRLLAKRADDADQARRLLSLAAILDGMSREEAAGIGAMDRQTLRDWVHRFNANGPAGLINRKAPGPCPKLSPEQKQELKRIVETPPDPDKDGVVRWRCVDLRRIIKERFDVDLDEVSIGRVLKELSFAHVSPRPQHPKGDPQVIWAFKKTFPRGRRRQSPARP